MFVATANPPPPKLYLKGVAILLHVAHPGFLVLFGLVCFFVCFCCLFLWLDDWVVPLG